MTASKERRFEEAFKYVRNLGIRPLAFILSMAGAALFSAFFVLVICRYQEHPIPSLGGLSKSIGIMGFDDNRPVTENFNIIVTDAMGGQTWIACTARGDNYAGTMNCDDKNVRQKFRNRHTTVWWFDNPPYGKMAMQIAIDGKLIFPYDAYVVAQKIINYRNAQLFGHNSHCKTFSLCLFFPLLALFYFASARKRYLHP